MKIGHQIPSCPFVPLVIPSAATANYERIQAALAQNGQRAHLFFLCQSTFEEPPHDAARHVVWHMKYIRDIGFGNYSDMVDVLFDVMAVLAEKDNWAGHIGIVSRTTPDLCGFFIVRWLIDELGTDPLRAMEMLAQSFPPGITKGKYLRALSRLYGIDLDEVSKSCQSSGDSRERRVPREALRDLDPEKSQKMLEEIRDVCDLSCNRIPLSEYSPFNRDAVDSIIRQSTPMCCITVEPCGIRGVLYVSSGEMGLFLNNGKNYAVRVTTRFTGSAVVEGVLLEGCESMFCASDIWMLNGEYVRSEGFRVRMGLLEDYILGNCIGNKSDNLSLQMRAFYDIEAGKAVMDCFREGGSLFKRYQASGISVVDMTVGNERAYLWQSRLWEYPRVRVHVDYAKNLLFGHATTKSTSGVIAFLGPATPEVIQLDGQVVEIDVVDKDPQRTDLMNGKVHRASKELTPWSFADFRKWYPDQKPYLPVDEVMTHLIRIAEVSPHLS